MTTQLNIRTINITDAVIRNQDANFYYVCRNMNEAQVHVKQSVRVINMLWPQGLYWVWCFVVSVCVCVCVLQVT